MAIVRAVDVRQVLLLRSLVGNFPFYFILKTIQSTKNSVKRIILTLCVERIARKKLE